MRRKILIAIFFGGLISCGQQQKRNTIVANVRVDDAYKPVYTVTHLNEKLEYSYEQEQSSISQFFIDWNRSIKPNSDNFINQNDTIKAVFNVYKEFYKPLDLLKLGEWEWGNKLNSESQYVAVQNKIFFSVMSNNNFDDFDWRKSKTDSIVNFRPPTSLDKNKVLYLTDEYAKSIGIFLGTESTELGEGNVMNPSRAEGESRKRYEILRPYIPILHGHWGGYWHLQTHPDISVIIFNKKMTKAKIEFRVGYQGGEAMLDKNGNTWTIKESKATWIE